MGYHVIEPESLEPMEDRPSTARDIARAAGLENMGLRHYKPEPGERIPVSGLHYHDEQEEVFYVVSGELRVETPEGEHDVPTGSFFVAEPGSAHRAYVPTNADGPAVVVAVGAPAVSDGHAVDSEE